MKTLDLEKKYQDFIIDLVSKIVPEVEIFIYGSRTKGKALKYSDVDIALKCDKEIPFDNILRLKALFSDSTLPYMVDISDKSYHKINYCDKKDDYYAKGVKAELRAENATEALDLRTEKVSGSVDFNLKKILHTKGRQEAISIFLSPVYCET